MDQDCAKLFQQSLKILQDATEMSQTGYYLAKIAASYMNHTIDGFAMFLFWHAQ